MQCCGYLLYAARSWKASSAAGGTSLRPSQTDSATPAESRTKYCWLRPHGRHASTSTTAPPLPSPPLPPYSSVGQLAIEPAWLATVALLGLPTVVLGLLGLRGA